MPSYNDEQKTISYIHVDEDTFQWIVRNANVKGLRIADYVGTVLSRARLLDVPSQNNESTLVFDLLNEAKRVEDMRQNVRQIAAIHSLRPDDEQTAEMLEKAAEAAGMSMEEVYQYARTQPFGSIVANARRNTKIGKCILWLTQLMVERQSINASEVNQIGETLGYAKDMIQRAKIEVQHSVGDPYTIESVRTSEGWTWHIVSRNSSEKSEKESIFIDLNSPD